MIQIMTGKTMSTKNDNGDPSGPGASIAGSYLKDFGSEIPGKSILTAKPINEKKILLI